MGLTFSKQSGAIGYLTMSGRGFDPDAQAFMSAAGITDPTQQTAINDLVNDLKIYSLWTKMKAVYPMVGGTATSHKFNLINPANTNAAFRLSFIGGWTHSSTGAKPDGVNGYADTFLNQNSHINSLSSHLSYYSRTANTFSAYDIGAFTLGPNIFYILGLYVSDTGGTSNYCNNHTIIPTVTAPTTTGLFCTSRTSNVLTKLYRNNSSIATSTAGIGANIIWNVFIGAINNQGLSVGFTNRECAFASIGDGLTDTDSANLYTAVQKFQTTLGRQV